MCHVISMPLGHFFPAQSLLTFVPQTNLAAVWQNILTCHFFPRCCENNIECHELLWAKPCRLWHISWTMSNCKGPDVMYESHRVPLSSKWCNFYSINLDRTVISEGSRDLFCNNFTLGASSTCLQDFFHLMRSSVPVAVVEIFLLIACANVIKTTTFWPPQLRSTVW